LGIEKHSKLIKYLSCALIFHQVDEHLKEDVKMFFVPYPEEQDNLFPAPSLPPISPAVSTPFKVNSSHEETQSEPRVTPASQALWEQVEKHPINAYAADNQVAEAKATKVRNNFTLA
jgi:hypothetical protein